MIADFSDLGNVTTYIMYYYYFNFKLKYNYQLNTIIFVIYDLRAKQQSDTRTQAHKSGIGTRVS